MPSSTHISDEFEVDDDDEEEVTIPSFAVDFFRRRNGSTETATAQLWKQLENEIFGPTPPTFRPEPADASRNDADGEHDVHEAPEIENVGAESAADAPDDDENEAVNVSSTSVSDKSKSSTPDVVRSNVEKDRRSQFRNRPRLWRQSTEEYYLSNSSSGKHDLEKTWRNNKGLVWFPDGLESLLLRTRKLILAQNMRIYVKFYAKYLNLKK